MNITGIVVLGIIGIAILADVYLLVSQGANATISWWILTNAKTYPAIPFLFGFLMGHFFGSQNQ